MEVLTRSQVVALNEALIHDPTIDEVEISHATDGRLVVKKVAFQRVATALKLTGNRKKKVEEPVRVGE
jgi:hypothetical protein